MMELGGIPADILSQHPWFPVNISGCHLLAKSWFGDTAYHVLLTDMKCVWEERMESAAIQSRAQELNRRLRAPVRAFYSHLREIVQPCLMGSNKEPASEAQIFLTRQEDGNIIMKLKSELAGLPFYWEFCCIPASVSQVCLQLVRPLLAMSRLLQHQVEQLRGLLLRKDAEIQDYKENGATLSRERLETEVFDEHTQREDFMAKALPLLCSEEQDSLGFSSELQHLYSVVTATDPTDQRKAPKRRLSEDPPLTKESDPTPSLALEEREAAKNGRSNTEATADDRSSVKEQSVSITSNPTERLSTKPKKKKVGLFK
ncbi:non-homologous end-joining factor 1 [Betta splendens]|uniref:Non-homologous end-joining factor 1 n=1 Tax=Betta splendens TaxID=158456 RepID=A0A6P7L7Y9_BETSP|nr:non-homologous end-joining factor 1 [Betta splendens]